MNYYAGIGLRYITTQNKKDIQYISNEIFKIINQIPKKYKNKDEVYFKKHYKTVPDKIVSQKYRSAKKYDTYLFPTFELAKRYHYEIQKEMFNIFSGIIDEVFPKMYLDQINNFAEIKDINLGDKLSFNIK